MQKNYLYIGAGAVVLILVFVVMFLFRPSAGTTTNQTGSFGTGDTREVTVSDNATPSTNGALPAAEVPAATQIIFKINDGPVAGATLIDTSRPTTTLARFVMTDSGRVFDLPLDVPGAVPRVVSNTTIPGIGNAVWTASTGSPQGEPGSGVLLQYLDSGKTKTLHLAFPAATTTLGSQAPVRLRFLPDGITGLAVSPDGKSAAYLVKTAAGSDGYRAAPDGGGLKKLFSLPLSQVSLAWPSANTLLAQSAGAAGVPGVVFSINASTGAVAPLLYADGLTALADRDFSQVIYQTADSGARSTYKRDIATGLNSPLSFDPFPERCVWSQATTAVLYCAAPLTYVPPNFLDLWRAGVASAADSLFAFNTQTGSTRVVATPGGAEGGVQSDIAALALSQGDRYLLFIRKGDRSLWAVRLSQ